MPKTNIKCGTCNGKLKMAQLQPGRLSGWALSCAPEVTDSVLVSAYAMRLDPQWGHEFPEAAPQCFTLTWRFSLPLSSLKFLLSLKINLNFLKKLFKLKILSLKKKRRACRTDVLILVFT